MDDPISDSLLPRWEAWKADIENLKGIRIPRCYMPASFKPTMRVELHHFSDASTSGYGACSLLGFVYTNKVHCCLVTSKARVTPGKIFKITRLELTAAVLQ
jgi:Pao retrotransposon peptidase